MSEPARSVSAYGGHWTPVQVRRFRNSLLAWFDLHQRDLPWRRTRDPYAIWVSEIMLQQTRVAAVLEHYASWMARFPTVNSLAEASEDAVLAAWSGLGYYRRARFLHQGAKTVVAEYAGHLPETAAALRQLPGIGAYTSAAIASIAFGEAAAVVDGNVERVLRRQTGAHEAKDTGTGPPALHLTTAEIQRQASSLVDPLRPGDFNQAMMELGATICLPKNPLCLNCPVQRSCRTRGEHPVAARRAAVKSHANYALLHRHHNGRWEVLLERRPPNAPVMPAMLELPPLGEKTSADGRPLLTLSHAIMQTNYRVAVFAVGAELGLPPAAENSRRRWVAAGELPSQPLTGLARKILVRLELLQGKPEFPAGKKNLSPRTGNLLKI